MLLIGQLELDPSINGSTWHASRITVTRDTASVFSVRRPNPRVIIIEPLLWLPHFLLLVLVTNYRCKLTSCLESIKWYVIMKKLISRIKISYRYSINIFHYIGNQRKMICDYEESSSLCSIIMKNNQLLKPKSSSTISCSTVSLKSNLEKIASHNSNNYFISTILK